MHCYSLKKETLSRMVTFVPRNVGKTVCVVVFQEGKVKEVTLAGLGNARAMYRAFVAKGYVEILKSEKV